APGGPGSAAPLGQTAGAPDTTSNSETAAVATPVVEPTPTNSAIPATSKTASPLIALDLLPKRSTAADTVFERFHANSPRFDTALHLLNLHAGQRDPRTPPDSNDSDYSHHSNAPCDNSENVTDQLMASDFGSLRVGA